MQYTVELAEKFDVAIGAQPSFPDLAGFGRRNMNLSPVEAKNDVIYQIGALQAFTKDKKLQHVKPHGAMYNMAVNNESLATAICQAVLDTDPDLILVALAGSKWAEIASSMGLKVAREAFADRAFNADGTLVPRTETGAVIHDLKEVVERSVMMVTEGKVTTKSGEIIEIQADSLCLHGDTTGAVAMAEAVRQALDARDVTVVPMGKLL